MHLKIAEPDLWSPDEPKLYRVEVLLLNDAGRVIDDYSTKYGFRCFEMDESRAFFLNDMPKAGEFLENEIPESANEPIYQTHRDELTSFRADLPDGWYEVTLHFAEVYGEPIREKLANNLGAAGDEIAMEVDPIFHIRANGEPIHSNIQLEGMAL
ncbi:MAG: malectin domain-containing carbohydrate-binding protein, partial [Opitutales bacterium]